MTTPTAHLSHPKYRPDIDGLRAVAVLSVVAFHAFPGWLKGGFIGVDVFFVISGFLITTIIFENLDKGTFSFSEFYARRIRRIFPALILVLLFCLTLGWLIFIPDELNQLGKHIAAGAGFVSNFILWGEAGYFDNSAETKPLLHLWSLGIEEQFYIVWPFLLWFAWKRNFNLLAVTVLVAIASFFLNLKNVTQDAVSTFYSPQTRFWELLSGSVLAWLVLYKFKNVRWLKDTRVFPNIFSVVGCSLLAYGLYRISSEVRFPGGWAIVPVLGASLVILGGQTAWINRKILSNKLVVWFGLIRFPLYLWHWPLLSFIRIVKGHLSHDARIIAVVLAIFLAWLTVGIIEKPFRFGNSKVRLKIFSLCGMVLFLGLTGLVISQRDFSESHGFKQAIIKRDGFEYGIGNSLSWYQGKDDWLFLGNNYDNTVAKLKLAIKPSEDELNKIKKVFSEVSEAGAKFGTKTILIVGPNKESIYPEYLPSELTPSETKYSSFFLGRLRKVPSLVVYDPTNNLLAAKESEGLLYWKTDTHWNNKGAYLAYAGLLKQLNIQPPNVTFKQGSTHSGDLIAISKLKNFPLDPQDNWDVIWKETPVWTDQEIKNETDAAFGASTIVTNDKPISNKYVWVVGDSFSGALRQYFNATFHKVRYVGHWASKIKTLPEEINKAERKPDLIFIVRVERSF
jgi:peptidoglycan/LPS O-acetylase OafA/YrhL